MKTVRYMAFFLCFTLTPYAMACMCVGLTLEQMYAEAKFVFVARVVSVHTITEKTDIQTIDGHLGAVRPMGGSGQFSLVRSFKGNVALLTSVKTGATDCDVLLEAGHTYIFFADPEGKISICSGTQEYIVGNKFDEKIIKQLEQLQKKSH